MEIITKRQWFALRREAALRRDANPNIPYRGVTPRTYGYGAVPGVPAAHLYVKKIPRAEWPERIRDRQQKTLFAKTRGILPSHDQDGHSDCWGQAPVRAVEIVNLLEGRHPHLLSVESIVVPIDGARDRGGNVEDAILQLVNYGACDQDLWPANQLFERAADPRWKENRSENKIIRFVDLEDYDDQITFALHDLPAACVFPWMDHAMCSLDPVQIGHNAFGLRMDNSWGDWGDKGTKVYDEESATSGRAGAWGVLLTTMQPL